MDKQVSLFGSLLLCLICLIIGYILPHPKSVIETKSNKAHGTELQLGVTKDSESMTHQLKDVEIQKVIETKPDGSKRETINEKIRAAQNYVRVYASKAGEKMQIVDISDQESKEVQAPRYSLGIIVYSAITPLKIGGMKLKPFYGLNAEMRIFGDIWAGIHYLPKHEAIGIGMRIQF